VARSGRGEWGPGDLSTTKFLCIQGGGRLVPRKALVEGD
jgi:hypothetical protein